MKCHDDGQHQNQHDSDRWTSTTQRYLETQAEVQREYVATHGAQTSPHLLARAQVARVELEELKREIASAKPASTPITP
jgi:hypothetical protein